MPAKRHNFTWAEIQAGALVLAGVATLAGFIAVIQGWRPESDQTVYHARFTNTIGLSPGADVRFGGVRAGRVVGIAPDPDDTAYIRVSATLAPEFPINAKSVATIEQLGLTAEKHLEVSTGATGAARITPGGEIRAVTKSGDMINLPDMDGVVARVEDLLDDVLEFLGMDEAREREARGDAEIAKVTRIADDIRGAIDGGTGLVDDLRAFVADAEPELQTILQKVQDIQDNANGLVRDVNAALDENRPALRDALAGVEQLVGKVNGVIDEVSEDLDGLVRALEQTLSNTEHLTGDARHLLETNRPAIEDMLLDLREVLRNLREFSRTMAEQPQAVIRGKTPEGRRN